MEVEFFYWINSCKSSNKNFRGQFLEVCVPSLVWNETRQNGTGGHYPNCWDHDETTYVWSCCLGKFWKNWGRDGTTHYFQYPTRKFQSSTEFWEFWELNCKILNLGIPVSFSGLRQDMKWPVLNERDLDGTENGWSRLLGKGNFSDFFEKNLVPGKCHLGTHTFSIFYLSEEV